MSSIAGGLCHDGRGGEIVKMGYLRKLKTMKKRFFILRGDSSEASARLEYYEDEKKWKKNHSPRRTISLKTCFNINRRQDTKHKHVIALYTKDDCFGLVLDSEEDLEEWLKALLSLQYGEDIVDGEEPKPTFEHVWQVTVLKKGLGNSRNILGRYLLCLTDKSLSLVKMSSQDEKAETYEFSLVSIRRCGNSECFFYMEVGRSSCTGEGELWMQTEDTNIADNMHAAIRNAMSNNRSKDEQPPRPRSSSTNEVSKPIAMVQRRQTHVGNTSIKEAAPPLPPTTSSTTTTPGSELDPQQQGTGRERSDSVPSRTRTISDGPHALPHPHASRSFVPNSNRPHSVCWPGGSPVSPASGPCSTDSPGSSLSIEEADGDAWCFGHSTTPDEPAILEENCIDDVPWPSTNSLLPPTRKFSPSQSQSFKSGSPNQDVYSPYGSSPLEHIGGYMAMSPGVMLHDGVPEVSSSARHAPSSSNHSRASSLAEETPNGYVPMGPVDDGYVDMDPAQADQQYNEDYAHGEMSPASSCSITSGTPSTDMRFSEYHLEKVSSYFTPSEEDETSSLDRPTRAYSVGSRPDTMRRVNRLEILNQTDASRVRAFSVGSRTVNKLSSRALAYDLYATRQQQAGSHHLTPTPTPTGKKSHSAPLLCNSWSGGGMLRHHIHGSSHSSVEPMDDLMEMDFTRNSRGKSKSSRGNAPLPPVEGYLDMSKQASTPPKSTIPTVSPKNGVDYHAQSQPIPTPPTAIGPYIDVATGSSPPVSRLPVAQRKTSTVEPPFPEIKILNNQPPGADVTPYQSRKPTSPIQEEYVRPSSLSSDEGYGGVSTVARTAPLDTPQPKKPSEGYVEMVWNGGSKPSQQSSLENYRPGSGEEYMNLPFEGRGKRKDKRKGRYSSQPIVIQAGEGGSPPVFSFGRKHSTGTPPRVLPLANSPGSSPSSSLRRNRARNSNRRESTESANLTTPTGSTATIFPFSLNSPGSPMKPFPGQQSQNVPQVAPLATAPGADINYDLSRKCPVDATSGTVRISYPFSPESTPTTPDSSSSSSEQPTPVNAESLNDLNKPTSPMNHDYVNFSPFHQEREYENYAKMRPVPVTSSRKISAPARVTNLKNDGTMGLPDLTLSPTIPDYRPRDTASAPRLVTSSSAAPNKEAVQFTTTAVPAPNQGTITRPIDTRMRQLPSVQSELPSEAVISGPLSQGTHASTEKNPQENTHSKVLAEVKSQQFSDGHDRPISRELCDGKPYERLISRQLSIGKPHEGPISKQLSDGKPYGPISRQLSVGKPHEGLNSRQLSDGKPHEGPISNGKPHEGSIATQQEGPISRQLSDWNPHEGAIATQLSDGKLHEESIARQLSAWNPQGGAISRQLSNGEPHDGSIATQQEGSISRQLSNGKPHEGAIATQLFDGKLHEEFNARQLSAWNPQGGAISRQLSIGKPLEGQMSDGNPQEGSISRQLSDGKPHDGCISRQLSDGKLQDGHISRQLSDGKPHEGCISRQLSDGKPHEGCISRQLSDGKLHDAPISRQLSDGKTQEGSISRQLSNSSVATGGSPSSSRPPSVSSERELHYASLDLAPSGSEGEDGSRSPRSIKTESSTSSPSPNPVNQAAGDSTFTYAEIDFAKSEGLRALNRKLRH